MWDARGEPYEEQIRQDSGDALPQGREAAEAGSLGYTGGALTEARAASAIGWNDSHEPGWTSASLGGQKEFARTLRI